MAEWPRAVMGTYAVRWLDQVNSDRLLRAGSKDSAYGLARFMRALGDDAGLTFPSHSTLAELLGITPRSVQSHIADLIDRGHLKIVRRGGKKTVTYRCVLNNDDRKRASGQDAASTGSMLPVQSSVGPETYSRSKPSKTDALTGSPASLDRKPSVVGPEAQRNSDIPMSAMSVLKSHEKMLLDRKPSVSEQREEQREEQRARAARQAPPLAEPLPDSFVPYDSAHAEPLEDTLARALGARGSLPSRLSEPDDFDEEHDFNDPVFALLDDLDPGPDDEDSRLKEHWAEAAE